MPPDQNPVERPILNLKVAMVALAEADDVAHAAKAYYTGWLTS
jgi:hypothetical protein